MLEVLEGTTLGRLAELLVQAEILFGSQGRLVPSPMEPDVDHRDLVVAEVGTYGALWLQVKGTLHPDREGRLVAFADYPEAGIPESSRLLYLVALLAEESHGLGRLWLIPSRAFNARAYRERSPRQGRVSLQFSCKQAGDPRWDEFELPPRELAQALRPLVESLGPAEPGSLHLLRP